MKPKIKKKQKPPRKPGKPTKIHKTTLKDEGSQPKPMKTHNHLENLWKTTKNYEKYETI